MCTEANRESLIAFVYGELPRDEQRVFETHLAACAPCRAEAAGLREVRDDLLAWAPPECRDLPSSWAEAPPAVVTPMDRMRAWAPAFGLAAAAMLVLAVSAAVANIQVRYGSEGFTITTGRAVAEQPLRAAAFQERSLQQTAVTTSDLAELEERLRRTFDESSARSPLQTVALSSNNPQLSRDMRRLIEENERRVNQEMAARIIEAFNEWDARRLGDYQRLQGVINQLDRRIGADLANQRNELNRLMLVVQGQGQK